MRREVGPKRSPLLARWRAPTHYTAPNDQRFPPGLIFGLAEFAAHSCLPPDQIQSEPLALNGTEHHKREVPLIRLCYCQYERKLLINTPINHNYGTEGIDSQFQAFKSKRTEKGHLKYTSSTHLHAVQQ